MRFNYSGIASVAQKVIDLFGGEFYFGKRVTANDKIINKHKIIAVMVDVDFAYTQSKDYVVTSKKYIVSSREFDRLGFVPKVTDILSLMQSETDLTGAVKLVKEINPSGAKSIVYEIYTSS